MKINLREELNKLDAQTYCKYDMINIYESMSMTEDEKRELVKMIANGEDADTIGAFMNKKHRDRECGACDECDETVDTKKEILYVIKDKHGNQLSRPNPNDSELWDRAENMDPYGRKGLKVVVYTEESLKENSDSHSIVDKVNALRKKYPKVVWFDNGKEIIVRETRANEGRLKEFGLLDYALFDTYNDKDIYVIDYSVPYQTLSANVRKNESLEEHEEELFVVTGYDKDNDVYEDLKLFDNIDDAKRFASIVEEEIKNEEIVSESGEPFDWLVIDKYVGEKFVGYYVFYDGDIKGHIRKVSKGFLDAEEKLCKDEIPKLKNEAKNVQVVDGKTTEFPRGTVVPEYLWTAVCNNKQNVVKKYFESGKEPNKRYPRMGHMNSLIMGALRNNNLDMVDLLKSFGETVLPEEQREYDKTMERLSESLFDIEDDEREDDGWIVIDTKQVPDSDGFYTDYTWYTDGKKHIFMFGDKDIYTPNADYADWEVEIYPGKEGLAYKEAEEWFNSYNGFDESDWDGTFDDFHVDDYVSMRESLKEESEDIKVIGGIFEFVEGDQFLHNRIIANKEKILPIEKINEILVSEDAKTKAYHKDQGGYDKCYVDLVIEKGGKRYRFHGARFDLGDNDPNKTFTQDDLDYVVNLYKEGDDSWFLPMDESLKEAKDTESSREKRRDKISGKLNVPYTLTLKNQYNYTVIQYRIDPKNKTIEKGLFNWGDGKGSFFRNRKELQRHIDDLLAQGYKMIDSKDETLTESKQFDANGKRLYVGDEVYIFRGNKLPRIFGHIMMLGENNTVLIDSGLTNYTVSTDKVFKVENKNESMAKDLKRASKQLKEEK